MRVFRLTKRKYAVELNGKGAGKSNNRWNSKGTEMVYTAESRALAMAEVAVHLSMDMLPEDFVMMEIDIPEKVRVEKVDEFDCGAYLWPPNHETQKLGDAFVRAEKCAVLKVPSMVVNGDFNYLINPAHVDFEEIGVVDVVDFPFDTRLFQ